LSRKSFQVNKFTIIQNYLQTFQVSTFILKAHSEVFVAALQPHTNEFKHNKLVITKFDVKTVEQMLLYMYSGNVDNLNKNVFKLFEIADYYQILSLMVSYYQQVTIDFMFQEICLKEMFGQMNSKYVVKCLEYAYRYNLRDLKECALDYASKSLVQVQQHPEWQSLDKEVFIDIMKRLVKL
jgi:hypothetical protein